VSKADEYVTDALASLELAERVTSAVEKRRLLKLAERWLDLADRVQERLRSKRKVSDHPLVKERLGDDHTDA
jgi:hypothetical protein